MEDRLASRPCPIEGTRAVPWHGPRSRSSRREKKSRRPEGRRPSAIIRGSREATPAIISSQSTRVSALHSQDRLVEGEVDVGVGDRSLVELLVVDLRGLDGLEVVALEGL